MLKIFLLIRSLNVGGAERQMTTLAAGLRERGYDVKVIVFVSGGALEAELRTKDIPIFDMSRKSYKDLPSIFLKLRKILNDERPDILYSFLPASNIWSGLMKIFQPHLTVVWGIRASGDMFKKGIWSWLNQRAEVWLSKKADWTIANSHAGRLYIEQRGYPKDRISVIPNGIDTVRFQPTPAKNLRGIWGFSSSEILIGMVGRIDPIKNYAIFLEAIALTLTERNDLRFICIGGGEESYVADLKLKAKTLGVDQVLVWAGEVKDMPAVYNSLDVLVLPSSSEGFPNVVAEAMACGVPCVVTDVGDAAFIVGDTGECFSTKDPIALKNGILSILQKISEDKSLQRRVRQRIIESFSVDMLIEKTSNLLEDLKRRN